MDAEEIRSIAKRIAEHLLRRGAVMARETLDPQTILKMRRLLNDCVIYLGTHLHVHPVSEHTLENVLDNIKGVRDLLKVYTGD